MGDAQLINMRKSIFSKKNNFRCMRVFYKCIHKEQSKKRKFCITAISAKLSEVFKNFGKLQQ